MRGAWGKPYGTVARVNIGQIILSIRCKDTHAPVIQEALRRARYKFPGRQKIIVSKKWGFTNVDKEDYLKLKEDKKVLQCVPSRPLTTLSLAHEMCLLASETEHTFNSFGLKDLSSRICATNSRPSHLSCIPHCELQVYFMSLMHYHSVSQESLRTPARNKLHLRRCAM